FDSFALSLVQPIASKIQQQRGDVRVLGAELLAGKRQSPLEQLFGLCRAGRADANGQRVQTSEVLSPRWAGRLAVNGQPLAIELLALGAVARLACLDSEGVGDQVMIRAEPAAAGGHGLLEQRFRFGFLAATAKQFTEIEHENL